jgi:Predicted transcriptional regulators
MVALEENPQIDSARRKSPMAFRTIAEVAGELDLPAHVLRFWESKFPQIKPLKRRGGRRYYRPEDVSLLRHIRALLYTEGYTIRGVQKLLRESGGKGSDTPAVVEFFGDGAGEMMDDFGGSNRSERLAEILIELELIRDLLGRHDR